MDEDEPLNAQITQRQPGQRLPPEAFDIDVDGIRSGLFSDKYFVRARDILRAKHNDVRVLMQVFTRNSGMLAGCDEAIAILKRCADQPDQLVIHALRDGDLIEEDETVMTIEGRFVTFAWLETVYLGVLSRGTSIATAVHEVVQAARDKAVLFFPARFDHYRLQAADGNAAFLAGVSAVSTDANGLLWGREAVGTIPHALIAAYHGDTVAACEAFDRQIPAQVKRIALVDFDNDSVSTSLAVARALGERLWGVRLDTASGLRDESVRGTGRQSLGVCAELVRNVRAALDENGFGQVKIVVSGGFTAQKVRRFAEDGIPFDAVGVGSSLYRTRVDFTADVVMVEGKPCAKVGRSLKPNPQMERVD